jgi:hypothetical protein
MVGVVQKPTTRREVFGLWGPATPLRLISSETLFLWQAPTSLKKPALLDNLLDNMTTKGRHFWRPLYLQLNDSKGGAEEVIRTHTVLLPPAHQDDTSRVNGQR